MSTYQVIKVIDGQEIGLTRLLFGWRITVGPEGKPWYDNGW